MLLYIIKVEALNLYTFLCSNEFCFVTRISFTVLVFQSWEEQGASSFLGVGKVARMIRY
jgi:hypothetical protein